MTTDPATLPTDPASLPTDPATLPTDPATLPTDPAYLTTDPALLPAPVTQPEIDVVVVGGGLAGITAALACADAGLQVTLLEARPRLGGRTASFQRDGALSAAEADADLDVGAGALEVDTGQHVFLRCCEAYLALLDRLGVRDQVWLQPRLDVPVLTVNPDTNANRSARPAKPVRISRGRAPAPLHLAAALARYRLLSLGRRLRLGQAALALRRVDPADPATDDRSFGDWLAEHGQDAETIAVLWDLITVATLNSPASESSLALAATVFQIGLLSDNAAGDLGWSAVPLGRLHGEAALKALTEAGVAVHTGAKLSSLALDRNDHRNVWRLNGVRQLQARQVILAVPPAAAERLLPPDALPFSSGWSNRLSSSPIVNVHVVYDRPVTSEPFLAAVGSPVQWVFDRTRPAGARRGQYLAVSLSAARDVIGLPTQEVLGQILPALAELLPAARQATVLDAFVTREAAATFAPSPGTARWRPPASTALPGLYLAGAWTATGWPDTMEGAVRSGNAAAAALLSQQSPSPDREEVPA